MNISYIQSQSHVGPTVDVAIRVEHWDEAPLHGLQQPPVLWVRYQLFHEVDEGRGGHPLTGMDSCNQRISLNLSTKSFYFLSQFIPADKIFTSNANSGKFEKRSTSKGCCYVAVVR